MAPRIDWYYHRKNCVTCSRSLVFLEAAGATIVEQVNAGKQKYGPEEALQMVREAQKVWVAKGKKLLEFDMQRAPPSDDELLKAIIGPSGNLRAPVIRRGKKMFIGFHAEVYAAELTG